MATFKIEPNENTLHGFFSRDLPPVLTIDSGDPVHFKPIDAEWGLDNFSFTTFEPKAGPPPRKTATPKVKGPMGHALCVPDSGRVIFHRRRTCLSGRWGSEQYGN
jgi:hypothetical protein